MMMELFKNKKDCCGCAACANICPKNAIEMLSDNEGFEFPHIDESVCVSCGLCEKVCPLKSIKSLAEQERAQKHIGIINLQFTANYGAVIAAAVLEDIVRSIVDSDYIVNTVNYAPIGCYSNVLARVKDEARQWGGWKLYLKSKIPSSMNGALNNLRLAKFEVFRNKFLNLTEMFTDASDINKNVNYSAFVVGSDVVWALKRTDNFRASGYYLGFADKGERKIAFAPSIDSVIDEKLIKKSKFYKENLKNLDFVSVREKSSVDFIQSLTDKKVYHCCDPAFLVEPEYYNEMIDVAKVNDNISKYIYVYILEENYDIVEYANNLAHEKNLKICYFSANHNEYTAEAENCAADGPAEFLYRLKNAEYVLTNSFHCVVFSLLFKKKFLSFIRSEKSVKAIDLLKDFELESRIVNRNDNIDDYIDFKKVEQKLAVFRESSLEYLKKALEAI